MYLTWKLNEPIECWIYYFLSCVFPLATEPGAAVGYEQNENVNETKLKSLVSVIVHPTPTLHDSLKFLEEL